MSVEQYVWLAMAGFAIGAYGTLIGAGGGFVLVPFLLWLSPKESPQIITSISLAVVFFNALSGSIAYARVGRIDYRSGLLFSIATIPGAILGALTTAYIPRRAFDIALGSLLVAGSGFLAFRPGGLRLDGAAEPLGREARPGSYDPKLAVGVSLLVGYFSSVLGIGGGIIHVPVLVHLLNFPVHIATATSHFTLTVMALSGTLAHVAMGSFHHGLRRTMGLAVGVVLGAQLGAWLSGRLRGDWIIRGLAIALGSIGVRMLLAAL